jgi:uncharacterized protein (TIGR00369 family)
MNLNELSGLELFRAMKEGRIPYPSMTDTIPMRCVEVEKGFVKIRTRADSRHMTIGGVHGGFSATVLDGATASAVHTTLEPGEGCSTLDLNIKILKPVPLDTDLVVKGSIIHTSKRIGVSKGELIDEQGNLYAYATATCAIFR